MKVSSHRRPELLRRTAFFAALTFAQDKEFRTRLRGDYPGFAAQMGALIEWYSPRAHNRLARALIFAGVWQQHLDSRVNHACISPYPPWVPPGQTSLKHPLPVLHSQDQLHTDPPQKGHQIVHDVKQ